MTFTTSTAPDITEGLPAPLSTSESAGTTASRGRVQWDLTIDGIGFVLGINDQNPYRRESAPVQKQQTDTSTEAGEQTLDGYWIRSQTSWHLGAGVSFYEPGARDGATPSQYRFKESAGVDVWTEGDISLLKATTLAKSAVTANVHVATARYGGNDYWLVAADGVLTRYDAAGTGTTFTADTAGDSRLAVAGATVMYGHAFGISAGPVSGSTLASLYGQALGTTPVPYWAKGRIIATRGRSVYELALDGSSGTTPGNLDTVTALYTHPDSGWTWTGCAETPSSILLSGYDGAGRSAIFSFTLEAPSAGATPQLGQPFQVAELPPGEEIHSIQSYLGAYLGVGTSRGLRVGLIGDRGQVQYGPLLFETTKPVKALAARGSFLYAGMTDGIDGKSGVARVNLGAPIGDSLRFAWATDAQTHTTGDVTSLAFVGVSDRVVAAVASKGAYVQSATAYEPTGYLTSGSIRYGTTEAKAFRRFDLLAATTTSTTVSAAILGANGGELPVATLAKGLTGQNLSLAKVAQQEYISYKLTLTGGAETPTVRSVAVKAFPAVRKQRLIQYPILLTSAQQDSFRTPVVQDVGEVLGRLESLESEKAVVSVQDYRIGERFPAIIESVAFSSTTPPTPRPRAGGNAGGRLTLTVRRVD